jgi:hypothetical protein
MSYSAQLQEINPEASPGEITGEVDITIVGDSVTFSVAAGGFEPGSMHLMHIHGFRDTVDTVEAMCAASEQDTNNDDYVDLIETQAVSGVTLIPFHDDPVSLQIKTDTYPTAAEDGTITYQKTVSLSVLEQAIKQQYGLNRAIFEHGVVYIHGVPATVSLPETVQSLPDVPASTTLPIACGELRVP